MALDLAFAEIIRRKGSLRCNLIVMDEVLTHLDSSGREAVGSVLRSMVSSGDGRGGGVNVKQNEVTGLGDDIINGEELLMYDEIAVDGITGGSTRVVGTRNKAEALERSRALIGEEIPHSSILFSSLIFHCPSIFYCIPTSSIPGSY